MTETLDRAWLDRLEPVAPDLVRVLRLYESSQFLRMRRVIRTSARVGTASGIMRQLDAVLDALAAIIEELPEAAFGLPGGEADWTVAEAVGHTLEARRQLTWAASLAARGRWPSDAPSVVPSVPGQHGVGRAELLGQLEKSRRSVFHAAAAIAGHEEDDCPLDHPLAGRMRCGEWLLFAGVHDLMHLEQLHRMKASE